MKHSCIPEELLPAQSVLGRCRHWFLLLAMVATVLPVQAQVFAVAPSTFNLNVMAGGSVMVTVTPLAHGGTGARLPDATVCAALAGGTPGVGLVNPCQPASVLGTVNVGAAASSTTPQTYGASYTPAQLSAMVSTPVSYTHLRAHETRH